MQESNLRPVAFQTTALPTELTTLTAMRAVNGIRTRDLLLGKQTLYQLSYVHTWSG